VVFKSNFRLEDGTTFLHSSYKYNINADTCAIIKLLISNGLDVNGIAVYGPLHISQSPLQYLLYDFAKKMNRNVIVVVETLIECGAKLNFTTNENVNYIPLVYVLSHNATLSMIRLLLQSGADPNYTIENSRSTLGNTLQIFINGSHRSTMVIEKIDLLAQYGANLFYINHFDEEDLLMYAARVCDEHVIKYLLSKKLDPNRKTSKGKSAFLYILDIKRISLYPLRTIYAGRWCKTRCYVS